MSSHKFQLNGIRCLEGLAHLHVSSASFGRGFMGSTAEVLSKPHVRAANEPFLGALIPREHAYLAQASMY